MRSASATPPEDDPAGGRRPVHRHQLRPDRRQRRLRDRLRRRPGRHRHLPPSGSRPPASPCSARRPSIADLGTTDGGSELAARLLDVLPDGKERLVARGLLRPGSGGTARRLPAAPAGLPLRRRRYREAGTAPLRRALRPALERAGPITVSNLELRLPVREQPGSLGGLVQTPAAPGRPLCFTVAGASDSIGRRPASPVGPALAGKPRGQSSPALRRRTLPGPARPQNQGGRRPGPRHLLDARRSPRRPAR